MKTLLRLLCLSTSLILVSGRGAGTETNLLPGVAFCLGKEGLSGCLLFVYAKNLEGAGTNAVPATVYAIDLKTAQLRPLAQTPPLRAWGFHPTRGGDAFSLEFGYFAGQETNVLVWVENGRSSRLLNLPKPPDCQEFADRNAAFRVSLWDGTNVVRRVIASDLEHGSLRTLELTNASRWEYQEYELPPDTRSTSNRFLEFRYHTFGKRLADGADYRNGIYSYDPQNGEIKWVREGQFWFDTDRANQRFDGQYVFFADHFPSASNNRNRGCKLAVSHLSESEARAADQKAGQFKVLTRFPKEVNLWALSPCRRYALALREDHVSRDSGTVARTYFLVDLVSGKFRVLLRDETARLTKDIMDYVHWVAAP